MLWKIKSQSLKLVYITFNVEVSERTVRPVVEIDFGQMFV